MRERPRDKSRLLHIMEACDIIANALARFGYEQILAEPLMYHGLVKHVEIIGEAIYILSKELKQDNPQIEWQAIEDLRHILVHDYYRINPKMLRPIVEKDVPELRPMIQEIYDKES